MRYQSFTERINVESDAEYTRLFSMYTYERQAYENGFRIIAGVDEAGRGPLAGPVVAASVILPDNMLIGGINDSKKLSAIKRKKLYEIIIKKAIAYGVGIIDEKVIDNINILNATIQAMEKAIIGMAPVIPDMTLIDAVRLNNLKTQQCSIIKGDSLSISIAAASILAKVTRDRIMDEYDREYPLYGFIRNKGYGTEEHINAIRKYGLCKIHRLSFTKNFINVL